MFDSWIAVASVVTAVGANVAGYLVAWGALKGTVAALANRVALLEGKMDALDELRLNVAKLETRLDVLIEQVRDLNASIRWMREPTDVRSGAANRPARAQRGSGL
jgi:hypothetical protein